MMTIEDIKRLNYIKYTSFQSFVKNPHNIITCYVLFIAKCVCFLLLYRKTSQPLSKILFIALTVNNRKSIRTIAENLSNSSYTIWNTPKFDLPKGKAFLKSIKYFPLFQRFYNSSSKEDKKLIRTFYDSFMSTCGYCEVYDEILKENTQLKLIVFANDHSIESRCMLETAEKYGVKTLYVQHASITDRFPPLHFSYSFLDGMESYEKYKRIGNVRGKVFLSGSPRFDELTKYKKTKKTYDVGIALNEFDSLEKLELIINYLKDKSINNIVVRPHPSMKNFPFEKFKKKGISVSISQAESSFDFISKLKLMIANESAIHLDAALMGVPSVLYNISEGEVLDWYGYLKNNLIQMCRTPNDLLDYINNRHVAVSESVVRYYNATYNTQYDGCIGLTIASFINALINGDEKKWIDNHTDFLPKQEK